MQINNGNQVYTNLYNVEPKSRRVDSDANRHYQPSEQVLLGQGNREDLHMTASELTARILKAAGDWKLGQKLGQDIPLERNTITFERCLEANQDASRRINEWLLDGTLSVANAEGIIAGSPRELPTFSAICRP